MEKYKYFKTQFDSMSNQGDTQEKLRVEISSEMAKEIVKGIENTDEQAIFIFYPNQMFVRARGRQMNFKISSGITRLVNM